MKSIVCIIGAPSLSLALLVTGSPIEAAASAAPICMARTTSGAPGGDHPVTVIVPGDATATYLSRGFAVTPCLSRLRMAVQTRRQICAIADSHNQQIEDEFFRIYAIKPSEYCGQLRTQFGR